MARQRIELYVNEAEAGSAEDEPAPLADKFAMIKSWGVDQVVVQRRRSADAASDAGLDVVMAYFWDVGKSDAQIAADVANAAPVGRLREIIMADEPDVVLWDEFDKARAGEPSTWSYTPAKFAHARGVAQGAWPNPHPPPLSLTFYGPRDDWLELEQAYFAQCLKSLDGLRLTIFPYLAPHHYRKVWALLRNGRVLLRRAGAALPINVVLQAWSCPTPPPVMLPPVAALRVMALLALFGGAQTVSFFQYNPNDWNAIDGYTDAFAAMVAELLSLAKELRGADVYSLFGYDNVLRSQVKTTAGDAWHYWVNANLEPVFSDQLEGLEVRRSSLVHLASAPWESASPAPMSPTRRLAPAKGSGASSRDPRELRRR